MYAWCMMASLLCVCEILNNRNAAQNTYFVWKMEWNRTVQCRLNVESSAHEKSRSRSLLLIWDLVTTADTGHADTWLRPSSSFLAEIQLNLIKYILQTTAIYLFPVGISVAQD